MYHTHAMQTAIHYQESKKKAAHLPEVTRVELVEEDTVVVLATSVTATAGMLSVLPDTSVARRDVPPLLAVLRETRRLQLFARTNPRPNTG